MKIKLNNILSYLFYLLPFALVFSRFLSDTIISVSGIIFIIISVIYKHTNFYKHYLSIIFFIWCGYLIIISLLSSNILLSLSSSLFYFRFGFFVFAFTYISNENKKFLLNFSISFFIIIIILFLDSLIQYFFGKNLTGHVYYGIRLSSFFGEEKVLGSFLSRTFLIPVIILLILNIKIKNYVFLLSVYFFFITLIVIFSGERTALFILIINYFLFLFSFKKLFKKLIIPFSIIISLISLTLYVDKSLNTRMFKQTFRDFNFTKESLGDRGVQIFTVHHTLHYKTAFEMFKSKPFFGYGPKMFREVCDYEKYRKGYYINNSNIDKRTFLNTNCSSHPHNVYMQLISETGIFGILPIIFLFLFCIITVIRKILGLNILINKYAYYSIIPITGNFWPLMPSGNFFNNYISLIYFLPMCLLFYILTKKNKLNL